MHAIFLVTVPHTGTHFMRNFFRDAPILPWMVPIHQLHKARCGLKSDRTGVNGLDPRRINLVQGHFHEQMLDTIEAVAEHWRPIVTLRDPLAATIGDMTPNAPMGRLMGNWSYLVHRFDQFNPHYVTLDLMRENKERREGLEAAVKAAQIQGTAGIERHTNEYAANWAGNRKRANSRGSYPLMNAYLKGDFEVIKQQMPTELAQLQAAEPWLRPFLEKRGYSDLQWWSGSKSGGADHANSAA